MCKKHEHLSNYIRYYTIDENLKGRVIMSKIRVMFQTPEEINHFVNIVNAYPFDMDMVKGSITVDAKSILSLMRLGINTEMMLSVHAEKCEDLVEDLEKYIAA